MTTFLKDPNAVLDFGFDWEDWLATGETISSYEVTVGTGITLASHTSNGTKITYWLSGGTAGTKYLASCKVTTTSGRTDERSAIISVTER